MLKIAFWFDAPVNYSGGLNYIKNTLFALSLVNDETIHPYIFFSSDIPIDIEEQFAPFAKVVRTKILQRRTLLWFIQIVRHRDIVACMVSL